MDTDTTARVGSHLVGTAGGFANEDSNKQANPRVLRGSPCPAVAESLSHTMDTPNENLLSNTAQTSLNSAPNETRESKPNVRKSIAEANESRRSIRIQSCVQDLKPWWPEALACFWVLMSLAAIIITLDKSDKKPLPRLPFRVLSPCVRTYNASITNNEYQKF